MFSRGWRMALAGFTLAVTVSGAEAASWHGGMRLGVNSAHMHGDLPEIADPHRQLGPVFGAFAEYEVVPSVALGVEALYVMKGATFISQRTDQFEPLREVEVHLRLHYIEVPALVRLSLPLRNGFTPYVIAGPTVALAVRGKVDDEDIDAHADVSDDLERFDVGVTGGVGARFGAGRTRFGLEARYGTGFNDLWDIEDNLDSINDGISVTFLVTR